MDTLHFDQSSISVYSNQNLVNGFRLDHDDFRDIPPAFPPDKQPPPPDLSPSSSTSSEGNSQENGDFSNAFLKYISEMLMEEDLEGKPCMLQDCLSQLQAAQLQAAEKSFYDVLGQNYPPSPKLPNQIPSYNFNQIEIPDDNITWINESCSSNSNVTADNLIESSNWIGESTLLVPDSSSAFQSVEKFWERIGKDDVTFDLDRNQPMPVSRGRKNYRLEDTADFSEERSRKQSAVYADEPDHMEMFDEVLLCRSENDHKYESCNNHEWLQKGTIGKLQLPQQHSGQVKGSGSSRGRPARGKKQSNRAEVVDLCSLLTQCAQAVAGSDHRTANDLLRQIRQHSSPFGDGTQRLSHYFADALETRLLGTGMPFFTPLVSNGTSAAAILKAYQVYLAACPFKRMSNFYATRSIVKLADKAARLHIIDFGILYGFQWPCLIQRLSVQPGGPPKLRITGIELPQSGFRPAGRVEETGRRLKKYCNRFNVPFEYNVIAQKWETIKIEDLKIDRDEVTIVNCLYRMKNLPDDTMVGDSARDAVLNLIKEVNPDIFFHGVVNGTFNAPFFVTRFREALFHFSSLFDMFEATVPREDQERMLFEKEVFGRDAKNVIASEGSERVERPETYKQWQSRNLRAGFRQLPLDREILKTVKNTVKMDYNREFVVDEDGHWMLQGWKGRVIYALSCWKPV